MGIWEISGARYPGLMQGWCSQGSFYCWVLGKNLTKLSDYFTGILSYSASSVNGGRSNLTDVKFRTDAETTLVTCLPRIENANILPSLFNMLIAIAPDVNESQHTSTPGPELCALRIVVAGEGKSRRALSMNGYRKGNHGEGNRAGYDIDLWWTNENERFFLLTVTAAPNGDESSTEEEEAAESGGSVVGAGSPDESSPFRDKEDIRCFLLRVVMWQESGAAAARDCDAEFAKMKELERGIREIFGFWGYMHVDGGDNTALQEAAWQVAGIWPGGLKRSRKSEVSELQLEGRRETHFGNAVHLCPCQWPRECSVLATLSCVTCFSYHQLVQTTSSTTLSCLQLASGYIARERRGNDAVRTPTLVALRSPPPFLKFLNTLTQEAWSVWNSGWLGCVVITAVNAHEVSIYHKKGHILNPRHTPPLVFELHPFPPYDDD
ncbi:hypothetical protein FB45DRAFT_878431 [Roridomyces roridus]|uniref:Uncharacterized protein n=1 Tax=Roridomyces roridus TaxID=1738132 RepID=A0AAD7F9H6_9AGAR|nr:hypothetical protein FB45DRAFT_878431 [Roridomyces roridus]